MDSPNHDNSSSHLDQVEPGRSENVLLALQIIELKASIRALENAARQTASKRDLFTFGSAILLVLFIGVFTLLFRVDNIRQTDLWHVRQSTEASRSQRLEHYHDVAYSERQSTSDATGLATVPGWN